MEKNYFERCYIAFYWTLEHIFRQSKVPVSPHPFSLCDLLSDMCPFTFATGMSADPAAYADYEWFSILGIYGKLKVNVYGPERPEAN